MSNQPALTIEIHGLTELGVALGRYPKQSARHLRAAAVESGKQIYTQVGLKKYPRNMRLAQFPNGFRSEKQRRFVMMLISRGKVPYRRGQALNSEKYGSQWYAEPYGLIGAKVGNRASYAKWLGGNDPSGYMQQRGWRRLYDVAHEQMPAVQKIYNAWIKKLIRACGLD